MTFLFKWWQRLATWFSCATAAIFVLVHATIELNQLTGNIEYTVNSVQSRETWNLAPVGPSASRIQFVFQALSIFQAELRIYESNRNSVGQTIFTCSSCGTLLPPPFYSTTGSIVISISGVSGVSFTKSSFDLQYIGCPREYTPLFENISINLNMGYGHISPILINNTLQPNSVQQWIISQPNNPIVAMNFLALPSDDIVYSVSDALCGAFVYVYDSLDLPPKQLLFSSCIESYTSPTKWFYSNTGTVVIELRTSRSSSSSSFELTFHTDTELYLCGSYLNPNLLRGRSMVLMDGSKSTNVQHKGQSCTWLIQPPNLSDRINLVMERVSLKFGSSVKVFDGTSSSSSLLWHGRGYTTTVPAMITSSSRSLYIEYVTDGSTSASTFGFRGEYFLTTAIAGSESEEDNSHSERYYGTAVSDQGEIRGLGKGYTVLLMSSVTEMSIYTSDIDVTDYNEDYYDNHGNSTTSLSSSYNYSWIISPENAVGPITFSFSDVVLTREGESLTIYDGTSGIDDGSILAVFAYSAIRKSGSSSSSSSSSSGKYSKWIRSTGLNAVIVYRSSLPRVSGVASVSSSQFTFSYFTDGKNYHCGFIRNPAVLRSASMIVSDGSQSSEGIYPDQRCEWTVQPPNSAKVVVNFERFSFRKGAYLDIYNGTVAEGKVYMRLENAIAPPPLLTFPFPVLGMSYVSTASGASGYGFHMTYYGVSNLNMQQSFPGDELVTLKSSSVTSLTLPKAFDNQEIPANSSFSWLLSPATTQGSIYVALSTISFFDCSTTVLEIFDGDSADAPLLLSLCSESTRTVDGSENEENILNSSSSSSSASASASASTNGIGIGSGIIDPMSLGGRITSTYYSSSSSSSSNWLSYQWVKTSAPKAFIRFATGESRNFYSASSTANNLVGSINTGGANFGDFDLSYYSDGPNALCGLPGGQGNLTAPSMVITDGSSSEQAMTGSQQCSWSIEPSTESPWVVAAIAARAHQQALNDSVIPNGAASSSSSSSTIKASLRIALEILSCDLAGGKLTVYDGMNSSTTVLWSCIDRDCADRPVVLFSTSSGLFVDFSSSDGSQTPLGFGFRAVYWTLVSFKEEQEEEEEEEQLENKSNTNGINTEHSIEMNVELNEYSVEVSTLKNVLLDLPGDALMTSDIENHSTAYRVHVGTDRNTSVVKSTIEFHSLYHLASAERATSDCKVAGNDDGDDYNFADDNVNPSFSCNVGRYMSLDGRPSGSELQLVSNTAVGKPTLSMCGAASTSGVASHSIYLSDDDAYRHLSTSSLVYRPTQRVDEYLVSHQDSKRVVSWSSIDSSSQRVDDDYDDDDNDAAVPLLMPATVCKYVVDTADITASAAGQSTDTSSQAVDIVLETLVFSRGERLRIYGGLSNVDVLIYDSNAHLTGGRAFTNAIGRPYYEIKDTTITAPCGHALVVFEYGLLWAEGNDDDGDSGGGGGTNDTTIAINKTINYASIPPSIPPTGAPKPLEMYNFTLKMSFRVTPLAEQEAPNQRCAAYIKSLIPEEKKDNMDAIYAMIAAAILFICIGGVLLKFAPQISKKYGICRSWGGSSSIVASPEDRYNAFRKRRFVKKTAAHSFHPKYRPLFEALRNRWLPKGYCVVCKHMDCQVFTLQCGHGICAEDLEGYLEAVLGDISMFPVKCPMHYESCPNLIGSDIAKRILSREQYNKFTDFSDRSTFGEGMRCIFCNNYVVFPPDGNAVTRCECPYCYDEFCVRCKQPWHRSSIKCPLESQDESLEEWKKISGAQKCPACRKIIEKNDPNTCHHMVHKQTDAIPCVRDRTDFCYLCGVEVLPDYPHDEVENMGVNHYPNGVFEKCRHVINEEKALERERLRRISRKTRAPRGASTTVRAFNIPTSRSNQISPEPAVPRANTPAPHGYSAVRARARTAPAFTPTTMPALNLFNTGGYMELSDDEGDVEQGRDNAIGGGSGAGLVIGDQTAREIAQFESAQANGRGINRW